MTTSGKCLSLQLNVIIVIKKEQKHSLNATVKKIKAKLVKS